MYEKIKKLVIKQVFNLILTMQYTKTQIPKCSGRKKRTLNGKEKENAKFKGKSRAIMMSFSAAAIW